MSTPPLLKTKLYIPPAPPYLVPRPRLLNQLNEGSRRKLTLLSAPPGFGKTTLVTKWISDFKSLMPTSESVETYEPAQIYSEDSPKIQNPVRSLPEGKSKIQNPSVAWVSLDEHDNDPTRFWSYAIAALETVQAGLGESALNLLYSPQPPPIETILTSLINNLVNIPAPLILTLDDYHLIENPDIHTALTFLLDHLPPQMHLVMISRADPPLPLTRLRVRGQLVELRAGDLRFTSSEVATFLNQIMGLNLSPDDIIALEARTEGWIAGLQLAALSMQGQADVQGFVQAFAGSHRYIIDYLVEEVLARQPAHVQKFLLYTSILQRLCGPLCETLISQNGRASGQDILLHLEQANLFLIPLDNQRRWYRYHHLFADVLQERLQNHLSPTEIAALHRRASAWYASHELIPEAVSHSLAARDFEEAGRLVEQAIAAILTGGQITTVINWLSALPEALVLSRPRLSLSYGWAMLITSQVDKVEFYLRAAEQALPARSELAPNPSADSPAETAIRGLWGEAMAMRAMLLANLGYGDVLHATELCEQALQWVPPDSAMVRSIIFYILGNTYESLGDLPRATGALTEAVSLSESVGNLVIALTATYGLARLKEEQGHLQEAGDLQRRALEMVEKQFGPAAHPDHISPVAGRAYMDMAEILREQNKLEQAKKFLTISLELGRRVNIMGTLQLSYLILARILQAQGDETGALEAIQQAVHLVDPTWPIFHWVKSMQARLWLEQGNLAEAVRWVETSGLSIGADFNYSQYPGEYATFVRVWLAQERFEEALSLLERMQATAQATGRSGRLLEIMILKALTHYAQGNLPQAFMPLAQALVLGQAGGYRRIFLDEGPPLAQLLHLARSRNAVPNTAYLNELLEDFAEPGAEVETNGAGQLISEVIPQRSPGSRSKTQPLLVEPLSERELEILQLVADGLSNQDIAARLVIAEGTVKKHLHNIFGKLDVRSRTQAIVRATELKLL